MDEQILKPGASKMALLALAEAMSQEGQREQPKNSNSGPMVDKYLAAVGLKPGYAWCMAFVNWCYEQAAKALNVPEPVVNTGGVLDCWNKTATNKKLMRTEVVRRPELILPGDQFIMKIGTKGAGHTGLIIRVEGRTLHTIEGNTNDEGSREGYEVAVRTRSLDMPELLGIIRY